MVAVFFLIFLWFATNWAKTARACPSVSNTDKARSEQHGFTFDS